MEEDQSQTENSMPTPLWLRVVLGLILAAIIITLGWAIYRNQLVKQIAPAEELNIIEPVEITEEESSVELDTLPSEDIQDEEAEGPEGLEEQEEEVSI